MAIACLMASTRLRSKSLSPVPLNHLVPYIQLETSLGLRSRNQSTFSATILYGVLEVSVQQNLAFRSNFRCSLSRPRSGAPSRPIGVVQENSFVQTPTTYITTSSMSGKSGKRKAPRVDDPSPTKKHNPASDSPKKDKKKKAQVTTPPSGNQIVPSQDSPHPVRCIQTLHPKRYGQKFNEARLQTKCIVQHVIQLRTNCFE